MTLSMTTMTALPQTVLAESDDSTLVEASRGGDRDAFGQLVRRYQGMVAGVIYARCGDLHRSEELAQETFLVAWSKLRELHDPDHIAAWLCQIARFNAINQVRSATRERAFQVKLAQDRADDSAAASDELVMSAEERQLLWRELSKLPEPYRETLVLYYRREQSSRQVALAMDVSDDAVRQRLTRGREMLREQLAQTVERGLTRSAPGTAFTLAVVAALPAVVPTTVKAATAGAAVKGVAATGLGASVLWWASMAAGPIMGIAGGVIGTRASLRAARSERERRFIRRSAAVLSLMIISATAILLSLYPLTRFLGLSGQTNVILQATVWVVYSVMLVVLIRYVNRRQRRIREEDGTSQRDDSINTCRPSAMGVRGVFAMLAGVNIGSTAWMIAMATNAHDPASAVLIGGAALALTIVATWFAHARGVHTIVRIAMLDAVVLMAITAVFVNWKMRPWIAVTEGMDLSDVERRMPLWLINLLLVAAFICVELVMFATTSRGSSGRSTTEPAAVK